MMDKRDFRHALLAVDRSYRVIVLPLVISVGLLSFGLKSAQMVFEFKLFENVDRTVFIFFQ